MPIVEHASEPRSGEALLEALDPRDDRSEALFDVLGDDVDLWHGAHIAAVNL